MGETDLAEPDFQVGNGCLVDQLVGQYTAHVVGLGYLLRPENVRTALRSIFRYNFRQGLYDHWNVMRTFALADESALLICSWPHGDRPRVPFPYFSEVMTGFEYRAAAHMIYEGLVEEGLTVIEAIRARFDGYRRNPWNEPECGHHYARAMASWAAILALSGFHYSGVSKLLQLAPRWRPNAFRCIWTIPSGWGMVSQTITNGEQVVRWEVLSGELRVQHIRYALPERARVRAATIEWNGQVETPHAEQKNAFVEIALAQPLTITAVVPLVIRIELA